jgi:hypothetical protein
VWPRAFRHLLAETCGHEPFDIFRSSILLVRFTSIAAIALVENVMVHPLPGHMCDVNCAVAVVVDDVFAVVVEPSLVAVVVVVAVQ